MSTQNTRYFIQVPVNLVSGKGLITTEKLVFGHIYTILNSNDKCFISNKKIGENIELSERSVSRAISKLKKVGLIDVHLIYKPDSKEIDKRYLTLSDRYLGGDTYDMGVVAPVSIPSRHTCLYPHDTDGVGNKKINKEFNRSSSSGDDSKSSTKPSKSFQTYEQLWGFPNSIAMQDLKHWIDDYSDDLVNYAIEIAGRNNVSSYGSYKYLNKILTEWNKLGIKTVKDAKKQNEQHSQRIDREFKQRKPRYGYTPKKEELPDWATESDEDRKARKDKEKADHEYKMQHDPEYRKKQEKTDKDLEDNLRRIRELRKEKNYE